MPDNHFASSQPWFKTNDENDSEASNDLNDENQKLSLENAELKKKLEKEKLFHRTLYKQWTDLNASVTIKIHELEKQRSRQNIQPAIYKYGFFGLCLITVILAVSAYNLSVSREDNTGTKTINSSLQNIEQAPAAQSLNTKSANATPANKEIKPPEQISVIPSGIQASLNNKSESSQKKSDVTVPGKTISGRYRVISKSYFCNDPDESTRRNTFVLPDNSDYGVVTALDDQNGFIYIVFTNHAGRTSKGWISKSDLEPLD